MVDTMLVGNIFFTGAGADKVMMLPLAIGAVCMVTSVIGYYFVKLGSSNSIMGALYKGLIVTGVLSAIAIAAVIASMIGFSASVPMTTGAVTGFGLFECALV